MLHAIVIMMMTIIMMVIDMIKYIVKFSFSYCVVIRGSGYNDSDY